MGGAVVRPRWGPASIFALGFRCSPPCGVDEQPGDGLGCRVGDLRVCVPKTSSTSCDLGILVNDAAKTITSADLELI
jgi:hypothetical protein